MGKRRQPRKPVEVPVRIFGTDLHGQVFSEKAMTVNVSRGGAEVSGVHAELAADEIVGLTYGPNRVHFRVKWVGGAGTPKAGHVGLLNVAPEKPLWDFPLPADAPDDYQPGSIEQRTTVRFRCQNPVEVHVHGGADFWGNVADLSVGGCYVEMAIPLPVGTKLKVGIWFGQTKAWAEAQVAHQTPGMGIGVKFTEISENDLGQIRRFLDSLAPFSRKPTRSIGMQGTKSSW
jgi:PilZ domain